MKRIRLKETIMNYIFILLVIMLISGCGSSHEQNGKKENSDFQDAGWITDTRVWPVADSLMYGDFPAPLFRREFTLGAEIKSATLDITAAGYYSASINGNTIGRNYLDPAWTNYSKRIYYSEFDLTSDLKKGANCLGVTLGNGFYNPLPMKMWSTYNLRDYLPVGKPVFIAKLKIVYANGKTEEINTDSKWKFSYGPVIRNSVYLGEVYNAGKEISGWNNPDFSDTEWENAVTSDGPGGKLEKAFFPPVQITGKHNPVSIASPSENTWIVDLGVNFTGLYKIRLRGRPGDTITFRFGERLYEDGTLNPMTSVAGQIKRIKPKTSVNREATWNSAVFNTDNGPGCPDVAWQTDRYIFGPETEITYSPLFTFHVFRYMEITGLRYKPGLSDIEGLEFHSAVENGNSFSCSSTLINSIQTATRRTFLDNLISVQSDCPGRERFGYGGDLNATADAFMYNFDMHAFYRKTIYDWVDAMKDSTFIDTAPFVGLKGCGMSWESAFIITQYKLLVYYNDTDLIRELYSKDLEWMAKAKRLHPSGIVETGLSDHESLVKVPVRLIGTAHYLECARIMQRFAAMMHDTENEKKFGKLSADLRESLLNMYWKTSVPDTINRQTLFSTLLWYDIVPENEKKAAVDSLLKAVQKAPSGHFTTGIFGTKYILGALSETGNAGSVFSIVNSNNFPGWGFMIDHGATTLWETWKESDNVYSNCHPMFGSVTEWFYRYLGGIQPDPENPGFRKFTIAPFLPSGLDYINCTYESPYGSIISNWKRSNDSIRHEITIPVGTSASFLVSSGGKGSFSIQDRKSGNIVRKSESGPVFHAELSEGNYVITY